MPALYAALARSVEVATGPVEGVTCTDLARWCGAEREDTPGVAIEKAIWRLRDGGWLIQTPGQGRKRRLLVAWGIGIGGHSARGSSTALIGAGLPQSRLSPSRWPCLTAILAGSRQTPMIRRSSIATSSGRCWTSTTLASMPAGSSAMCQ